MTNTDNSRIPHFYNNFYVYQYATEISASTALSKQILNEGEAAVERYINEFLKAGSSDFAIEVLKKAGVDMNSPEPIEQALKVFEKTLDELEYFLMKRSKNKLKLHNLFANLFRLVIRCVVFLYTRKLRSEETRGLNFL